MSFARTCLAGLALVALVPEPASAWHRVVETFETRCLAPILAEMPGDLSGLAIEQGRFGWDRLSVLPSGDVLGLVTMDGDNLCQLRTDFPNGVEAKALLIDLQRWMTKALAEGRAANPETCTLDGPFRVALDSLEAPGRVRVHLLQFPEHRFVLIASEDTAVEEFC